MHKSSTAATKSSGVLCAPPARPASAGAPDPQTDAPGLLNVRRGQPVADPNRTSSTTFTGVARFSAVRTVRASHRLAPTSLRGKNLCIVRASSAFSALVLLFLSSFTFGQIYSPDETVSQITDNLMCTCGCPHIIGHCGDECSVAPQLVHEISELVTAGNTEEEVYKIFEDKYGLRVRAVPTAEGFNLLVWVMPFVGLLAGVVVIFFVINRLKPDDSNQETEKVHPVDERYRKLIDRELER